MIAFIDSCNQLFNEIFFALASQGYFAYLIGVMIFYTSVSVTAYLIRGTKRL